MTAVAAQARLTNVEAQRIIAVLDDAREKLKINANLTDELLDSFEQLEEVLDSDVIDALHLFRAARDGKAEVLHATLQLCRVLQVHTNV